MQPDTVKENESLGPSTLHVDPHCDTSSVLDDIRFLWLELRGLSHDHVRLAALETRRAGQSLVTMVVAGMMLALLLNGAWLGLLAAGATWLIENGLNTSSAIFLTVALNLVLLLIVGGVIRRRSRYLQFPALLRSLRTETEERENP
ncbi:phage holin family protein [Methylomonas sp. LL1]|uniref:phage holin family protein n=1 Tax=Methylomonas sp. LL1 TaxID=2785785 RepID=UPI0018C36101|nr:phage holin family protein [Methylomonas sp. LL1]QPK64405.1 phage holin family protein [Methylomonas sp. LL1]CAG1022239.1 hypothetical protein MTYM_01576 [Methylococcales bacterium]